MTGRQVILITGTSKGIGRFLAEHYVRQGMLIEGCSRETPNWELKNYTHHTLDIADEAAVKAMFASIQRRHGRLDVAINNAGIAAMNHVLLTPVSTVDRILGTNVRGTFLICREGAKLMQRRCYGRIVNLTTIAAPMLLEGEALYAASKSAVETLAKILARELGALGVTVNAVGPPPTDTDLIRGVPEEKINRIIDQLAIKRKGRLEDVANVIDFFIRPESDYVTGQIIYLGGVS